MHLIASRQPYLANQRENNMKGRAIPYSQQEMQWLHDNHKLMISDYHQQFCDTFNRTDVSKVNLNSLRKRKGWRTGRTGHFHKG